MADSLDMSLDDIIRKNKKSGQQHSNFRGSGRFRGRGSGPGPDRRLNNSFPIRTTPYFAPQAVKVQTPATLIDGGLKSEEGTKLYISNLDYGVSNEDIKLLFNDIGELKRYAIHYDRSGQSKGTAEVVFMRQSDALVAMRRYNNVQLDGKPMMIQLVGADFVFPMALPPRPSNSILGNPWGAPRRQAAGMGQNLGSYGGRISMDGRGRGQGRGSSGPISTKDLDADLDKYHLEAMQIQ